MSQCAGQFVRDVYVEGKHCNIVIIDLHCNFADNYWFSNISQSSKSQRRGVSSSYQAQVLTICRLLHYNHLSKNPIYIKAYNNQLRSAPFKINCNWNYPAHPRTIRLCDIFKMKWRWHEIGAWNHHTVSCKEPQMLHFILEESKILSSACYSF